MNIISISVKNEKGINLFFDNISEKINFIAGELNFIKNAREVEILNRIENHLTEAKNSINMNTYIDLISIDLRAALQALDELTGESVDEDIINEIFSKFCIGK